MAGYYVLTSLNGSDWTARRWCKFREHADQAYLNAAGIGAEQRLVRFTPGQTPRTLRRSGVR